jgi:hypothetical protein
MRLFANMFLLLFIADGGFSLVDELVSLLTPLRPYTDLRNFLAGNVILLSIPLYISLGFDRRLPKRLFLPMIGFVFWTIISTWIFPVLAEVRVYGLFLAALQVALGMLPLLFFRTNDQRRVTMPPELFQAPFFSTKNSAIFFSTNLLVIPIALLLVSLSVVNAYMTEYTSGFMRLGPGGLSMTERIYERDNRTIRLAAMIHIGSREYFRSVAESVTAGRTIVLAEGVSDDSKLLKNGLDYGKVAGLIGLASQDKMLFKGNLIDEDDLASDASDSEIEQQDQQPDILRADVDLSTLRPQTITFLDAISRHMRENESALRGFLALNKWAEKNISPDMYATIMDDILHHRNMVVLGHLDKALTRYETVVIPWGALHMKELESEILKRGFVKKEEKQRTSIDFTRLALGRSKP